MNKFQYSVYKKPNRKTASLSVSPDNKISLIVPDHLKKEDIDKIIQKKSKWIRDKLRFNQEVKYPFKAKEYVSGEAIIYTGRNFRLKVIERPVSTPARLNGGWLVVAVSNNILSTQKTAAIKNSIQEWYMKVALNKFKARTLFYQKRIDQKPADIIIKSMKTRWGSCYKSSVVAFNWKVIMAPMKIIDYVVVHELCHLKYHDHSPKYWELLGSIIPDWRERKEWLRVNGGMLVI